MNIIRTGMASALTMLALFLLIPLSFAHHGGPHAPSPSMTISLASSPVVSSGVRGTDDARFTGINFTCSSVDDCLVTDVLLNAYIDEDATGGFSHAVDNGVYVRDVVYNFDLVDELGNPVSSFSVPVQSNGELHFQNFNFLVPAGANDVLYVRGSVRHDAYANNDAENVAFSINDPLDVTFEDSIGSPYHPTGTVNVNQSAYLTIAKQGSLTIDIDPLSEHEDIVVAGTSGVNFSSYGFTSTNEPFIVRALSISSFQSGIELSDLGENDRNFSAIHITYLNSAGISETKNSFLSNGVANFTGMDLYVPMDDSALMTVSADLNTIQLGGAAIPGSKLRLDLSLRGFNALSQVSGTVFNGSEIDADELDSADLYFGNVRFQSRRNELALVVPQSFTAGLGNTGHLNIDDAHGDNSRKLQNGSIVCVDDDRNGQCNHEDIYIVEYWPNYTSGSFDSVQLRLVDDAGDGTYNNNDPLLTSQPGSRFLRGTDFMHVHDTALSLTLSPNSPGGSSLVSRFDNVFSFDVFVDSNGDTVHNTGKYFNTDSDPVLGGRGPGPGVITVQSDPGNYLEGTGGIKWNSPVANPNRNDCFVLDDFGTDLEDYEYVSFWMKADMPDVQMTEFALVLEEDTNCAGRRGHKRITLSNSDLVTTNDTAVGVNEFVSPSGQYWKHVTVDISEKASYAHEFIGIAVSNRVNNFGSNESVFFDDFVVHNEMIRFDLDSGTEDFYLSAELGPALLHDQHSQYGIGSVGMHNDESAAVYIVPDLNAMNLAANTSTALTLQMDTLDMFNNNPLLTRELLVSIDRGNAEEGGGFWWSDTHGIIKWLGDVDEYLNGNLLFY